MTSGKCSSVSGFAATNTRAGMFSGSDRYAYRIVLIQSFRSISNLLKSVEYWLIYDYINI